MKTISFMIHCRIKTGAGAFYTGNDDSCPEKRIPLEDGRMAGEYILSREFEEDFAPDVVHNVKLGKRNSTTIKWYKSFTALMVTKVSAWELKFNNSVSAISSLRNFLLYEPIV